MTIVLSGFPLNVALSILDDSQVIEDRLSFAIGFNKTPNKLNKTPKVCISTKKLNHARPASNCGQEIKKKKTT